MTLVEHLEELRSRLFIALGAIGLGSVIGWFLYGPVLQLLQNPYCDTIENLPSGNRPPTGCKFVFTGVLEPVIIKLKVVVFLGLFIALPIVLWQLWAFVVPGLTRREHPGHRRRARGAGSPRVPARPDPPQVPGGGAAHRRGHRCGGGPGVGEGRASSDREAAVGAGPISNLAQ